MKNLEKIMVRDAISQMLADNGINRETLMDMVREIVAEKTEQALKNVIAQTDINSMVYGRVHRCVENEVASIVRRSLNSVSISIKTER